MKKFILLLLLQLVICFPSLCTGADVYENQLDNGIRNSEPYSYLLIQKSKTDPSAAKSILKDAHRYSPDLPAVYFELAKDSLSFRHQGIFKAVDYTLQGIAAYERNFWWTFMVTASFLMSVILSFVISVFVIVIIRTIRDIPLISHDIKEDRTKLLLLLVFIFAIFGPLYLLGSLLVMVSFYLRKWDRIVLYLYLVFLLFLPFVFKAVSMVFSAPTSAELRAVVDVNESKGNRYALSLLKASDNPVERFSYALALKREGRYGEAIDIYKNLVAAKPNALIYNNLANCYVAINDIETAKELYTKANGIKPLPSSLYNLSQVYRKSLDFDKGEEFFLAAQRLDSEAVSAYRAIVSWNPNRFVIDEGMPKSVIWEYSSKKAPQTTTMGLSTVPLIFMPAVAIAMIIFFSVFDTRVKNRAYRCNRCGKILCNKCEKHILWGRMCLQCYRSLVKLDELDAKERIARILTVYEHRKKKKDIIKLLSLIIPGSGQIYSGNILYGLLFLWPFLFFFMVPVMNSIFVIEMSAFSHIWLNLVSIFLMIAVYFISNVITRRRIAKGWL